MILYCVTAVNVSLACGECVGWQYCTVQGDGARGPLHSSGRPIGSVGCRATCMQCEAAGACSASCRMHGLSHEGYFMAPAAAEYLYHRHLAYLVIWEYVIPSEGAGILCINYTFCSYIGLGHVCMCTPNTVSMSCCVHSLPQPGPVRPLTEQ